MKIQSFVFALGLLLFSQPLLSQTIDFGLRLGAGVSQLRVNNFDADATWESIESGDLQLSYHGGLYAKFKFGAFFFQPELLYAQIQQEAQMNSRTPGGPSLSIPLDFQKIEVPLLLGSQIGPVRLMVGPTFSILISDRSGNFNEDLKAATVGYQAGLGVQLGNLSVDLRYDAQLSQTADQLLVDRSSYAADLSGHQFMLCLGFAIF